MSEHEAALQAYLEASRIHAVARSDVPSLVNRDTGRRNSADFFLPATALHIEVKGQMSLDAIRKLTALARATSRYYLYQHRDWAWDPKVADWPDGVLSEAQARALQDRATKARRAHDAAHPSRSTRAARYPGAAVAFARALQQEEILLMSRGLKIANAASTVTLARLKRYVDTFIAEIGFHVATY